MHLDEKLTIETPEQTALEFPLAGIGSRFLAIALDTLLQTGAIVALILVAVLGSWSNILPARAGQWGVAIGILALFLLQFGYFAIFEALWNGQTPGKRWTHLRVIKDSGRPIAAPDAALRNLLRIVDSLPSLYAVGIISMLFSRENKRLGDFAAGTVVVHEKPLRERGSPWSEPAAAGPMAGFTPGLATAQLTVEELQLAETFLERRKNLEPIIRRAMARQIADRLGESSSIPREARPDPEKFLEALAETRRNLARFR